MIACSSWVARSKSIRGTTRSRTAKHIGEEQKHEKLCLHDLNALGLALEALPQRMSTKMFWEPQYYKVEHEHPSVLMGYILALEALACVKGPWILAQVTAAHGEKAGHFIKVHAEEDISHVEKAYKSIEPLPELLRREIAMNIVQTTDAYIRILEECASARPKIVKRPVDVALSLVHDRAHRAIHVGHGMIRG